MPVLHFSSQVGIVMAWAHFNTSKRWVGIGGSYFGEIDEEVENNKTFIKQAYRDLSFADLFEFKRAAEDNH